MFSIFSFGGFALFYCPMAMFLLKLNKLNYSHTTFSIVKSLRDVFLVHQLVGLVNWALMTDKPICFQEIGVIGHILRNLKVKLNYWSLKIIFLSSPII